MKRIITAVLCLACVTATAQEERFSMRPSIDTPYAQEALLVDVEWAGDRLVAVGEQGHIIYSDDGGSSWTNAEVPVSLMLTAVSFPTPDQGWAVGHEGIVLRSTDGGASWSVVLTGEDVAALQVAAATRLVEDAQAALDEAPDDEELQYALEDAEFVLEDAQRASEEGLLHPALDVWFESPEKGYVTGAYRMLLRTTDGGNTWQLDSAKVDNPDGYHLYGVTRLASGTLLLAGEAGQLHRSRDDGETWERLDASYAGSFFGVLATSDGAGLVFGLRGNIFRTDDDGETWMPIDAPGESTLFGGNVLPDGRVILVGAAGTVLESRDGGQSFSRLSVDGRQSLADVEETADGSMVIAGFGGVRVVGGSGGS